MNFENARLRLLVKIREHMRNGDTTERGFARSAGISQPHIHNVLKGTKFLSPEACDSLLKNLNCGLLQLCTEMELRLELARRQEVSEPVQDIMFSGPRLGPGSLWNNSANLGDHHPVPCAVLRRIKNMILVRLAGDPAMQRSLGGFDIAGLDPSPLESETAPLAIYAIHRGSDTVLRRVRWGSRRMYLITDENASRPELWEALPVRSEDPLADIRGRVCWLGEEGTRRAGSSASGYFLDESTSE